MFLSGFSRHLDFAMPEANKHNFRLLLFFYQSSESQMEERKFWKSQLEEIEGLQFRQETGTHLASLVVEEEVCVFICFIFLSRNQI